MKTGFYVALVVEVVFAVAFWIGYVVPRSIADTPVGTPVNFKIDDLFSPANRLQCHPTEAMVVVYASRADLKPLSFDADLHELTDPWSDADITYPNVSLGLQAFDLAKVLDNNENGKVFMRARVTRSVFGGEVREIYNVLSPQQVQKYLSKLHKLKLSNPVYCNTQ